MRNKNKNKRVLIEHSCTEYGKEIPWTDTPMVKKGLEKLKNIFQIINERRKLKRIYIIRSKYIPKM